MSRKAIGERVIRNLRLRYALALGLVALLSLSAYALTRLILAANENDVFVVNIAGRQRMLSQRIAKEALLLRDSDFKDAVLAAKMVEELEDFTKSHEALRRRDSEMGLYGENSEAVMALFEEIQGAFETIVDNTETLYRAYESGEYVQEEVDLALYYLLQAEREFLPLMNQMVFRFNSESADRINAKIKLETAILFCVLSVLLFEVFFIFKPTLQHLRKHFLALRNLEKDRLLAARETARQNRKLKRAVATAEESTRLKSEFLATMSHEIRTPMNATVGMTSLLLDTELTDHQREFAETIRNSSDALLVIINDILDFSKIESGNLQLDAHVFNLRETVEGALALFRLQASQKKIEIAYFMDDNVPEFIESDGGRLRQIIVNLFGNAVKFTEEGSVVLRISLVTGEEAEVGRVRLRFEIEDTGIGIPEDKLEGLFDPFSQADGSTTRRYGGTGLGLSISRLLSQLMGGTISVQSTLGKGSVFTFYIDARPAKSLVKHPVNELQTDMEGGRILIVDDNEVNRELLVQIMARWGMEALVYESPVEALSAIEDGLFFDLGVIDCQLPEVDGISLAEHLRSKLTRLPPLVAMTSGDVDELRTNQLFMRVFTKPLRPGLLLEAFWELLAANRSDEDGEDEATSDQIDTSLAERMPLKILIADDNAANLRVASLLLERMGYAPDTVSDGGQAYAAIVEHHYDVVLMDIHMPIMDGLEATKKVRAEKPNGHNPWVIALTAAASNDDRRLCLEVGMNDYLTKPFKPQDIRKAFSKYKKESGE